MTRIQVNRRLIEAEPGEMLIAATDRAGIYIPRFCYHRELSIAANCRMCLVEVGNAPKPFDADSVESGEATPKPAPMCASHRNRCRPARLR